MWVVGVGLQVRQVGHLNWTGVNIDWNWGFDWDFSWGRASSGCDIQSSLESSTGLDSSCVYLPDCMTRSLVFDSPWYACLKPTHDSLKTISLLIITFLL